MHFEDEDLQIIFDEFKALCDRKKHVTEEDILALVRDKQTTTAHSMARLITFDTQQLKPGHYSATVVVSIHEQEQQAKGEGDGPLDAIFKAINGLVKDFDPNLMDFEVHSISHGTDAQAEASITLDHQGNIFIGHARDTDTVMASTLAYISAVNKVLAAGGHHVR
jgi:2-isopropylmalate synthase